MSTNAMARLVLQFCNEMTPGWLWLTLRGQRRNRATLELSKVRGSKTNSLSSCQVVIPFGTGRVSLSPSWTVMGP